MALPPSVHASGSGLSVVRPSFPSSCDGVDNDEPPMVYFNYANVYVPRAGRGTLEFLFIFSLVHAVRFHPVQTLLFPKRYRR